MNKFDLSQQISEAYTLFASDVKNLAYSNANLCINHNWSVNQNIDHINLSLTQLNKYFLLPKEKIQLIFGLTSKGDVTMATFTLKLNQTLKTGIKSTITFTPDFSSKNTQDLILKGQVIISDMVKALMLWSDEDLDTYNCPHPVLGKISAREMLFFTIYHIRHHHSTTKELILNNFS
ncbi:MAG: DinB family protein [Sphingobacteriales bacterium]|nr:MAG: DinB family protein [Sphingobacteriales bacterium]